MNFSRHFWIILVDVYCYEVLYPFHTQLIVPSSPLQQTYNPCSISRGAIYLYLQMI